MTDSHSDFIEYLRAQHGRTFYGLATGTPAIRGPHRPFPEISPKVKFCRDTTNFLKFMEENPEIFFEDLSR